VDRRQGGVRARGQSIVLDFYYQGERLRCTLPLDPSKKAHWNRAEDLLGAIRHDIAIGTFHLAKYFPNHPKAKSFRSAHAITIADALDAWLEQKRRALEQTTWRSYRSAVEYHLKPQLGHLCISQLTVGNVKEWLNSLGIETSNQRINNVLIPLRAIFADAYADELIDRNPLARIKGLPRRTPEVEPFSRAEMQNILDSCEGQIRNLFTVGFWTGLRTSELIALRCSDIDMAGAHLYVRRTRNWAVEKSRTKTEAGTRSVKLLPPSLDALKSQKSLLATTEEHVFLNPRTNKPWRHDGPLRKTAWIPCLRNAGIPYRKPYAMRHTYASMMLTAGEHPMWVAQQMGHKDWGMIRKVYGRWIPDLDGIAGRKIMHLWARDGRRGAASA
jgi:integrase